MVSKIINGYQRMDLNVKILFGGVVYINVEIQKRNKIKDVKPF